MSLEQIDRVIARFSAMKAHWSETVSLEQMRADLDRWSSSFPAPSSLRVETVSAGGVAAEWVQAGSSRPRGILVYFHGGGFATGSMQGTRHFAGHLSAATETRVLVVGYRLAPEFTFPAQIEDAEAAYRWLLAEGHDPQQIAVGGDSAGGGLCLALIGRLSAYHRSLPACAVLFTPWADMRCEAASYESLRQVDPIANKEIAKMMATTYLGAAGKADDARATPVLGDFTGYCPLLIQAAGRDVFRDDARDIHARAKACGVLSELDEWAHMIHQWQLYASEVDESRSALNRARDFLLRHFRI